MARKQTSKNLQIVRYTGKQHYYILGVPTRDLSLDEFEALSEDLRKRCIESGLYQFEEMVEAGLQEK